MPGTDCAYRGVVQSDFHDKLSSVHSDGRSFAGADAHADCRVGMQRHRVARYQQPQKTHKCSSIVDRCRFAAPEGWGLTKPELQHFRAGYD